jgi:hypothetical protein
MQRKRAEMDVNLVDLYLDPFDQGSEDRRRASRSPSCAAIRTHHVSTALSQGSPFYSLIFKCPAWEARSLPELQRRHGQICEWSLHQAPFDQVRMQRFSRSPTKPLT